MWFGGGLGWFRANMQVDVIKMLLNLFFKYLHYHKRQWLEVRIQGG